MPRRRFAGWLLAPLLANVAHGVEDPYYTKCRLGVCFRVAGTQMVAYKDVEDSLIPGTNADAMLAQWENSTKRVRAMTARRVLPESESVSRLLTQHWDVPGQLDKLNAMNVLPGNIKALQEKVAVRSVETANSGHEETIRLQRLQNRETLF